MPMPYSTPGPVETPEQKRRREMMGRSPGSPFMATHPPMSPAPLPAPGPMSPAPAGLPKPPGLPAAFAGATAGGGANPPKPPVPLGNGRSLNPAAILDRAKDLYAPVAGASPAAPAGPMPPTMPGNGLPVGVGMPPGGPVKPQGRSPQALDAEAARLTGLGAMFEAGAVPPSPAGPSGAGSPGPAMQQALAFPPGMSGGGGGFGPFGSKEQWAQQFAAEHGGRMPNEQDEMDARSSFDFLAQKGRAPTDQEWKDRYYQGGFDGVQEMGGSSYTGGGGEELKSAMPMPPGMGGAEEMVTMPDGTQVPASLLMQILGGQGGAAPQPQGNPVINQWLPGWTY